MAKSKAEGVKKVANRYLYARLSYLQQAVQLLSGHSSETPSLQEISKIHQDRLSRGEGVENPKIDIEGTSTSTPVFTSIGLPLVHELSSHIRAIAQKSVIRLSSDLKRSICGRCSAALIDGSTCTTRMENKSRNGRKPRADVLVITCIACQMEKRFPVGQPRTSKVRMKVKKEDKKSQASKVIK